MKTVAAAGSGDSGEPASRESDGAAGRDGRAVRARRTREAVITALHDLIVAGDPRPSATRIAERAGVSTRTVFAHFATLEDLYGATVERATALVMGLLTPIAPDRPLAERVRALSEQRGRVNEEVGPLRRAAALQEPFSPTLAEARRYARRASYEQVERVLAPELSSLGPEARRRWVAALDAALGGETWDLLRLTHELSPDEARRTVEDALGALLAAGAPAPGDPGPAGVAAAAAAVDADEAAGEAAHAAERAATEARARLDAARRALAEVETKVDRLVTAIESGSPADLLAPRLRALRAAKAAAERAVASAGGGN